MRNRTPDHPGADVPAVSIAPPLRCYYRGENSASSICGRPAAWSRPGNHWFSTEYFCDEHRGPSDLPAPAEHVFRRVRFNVDVLVAGAHLNAPVAHVEALERIGRAVAAAGGVMEINAVTSHVVRSCPLPAPRRTIDPSGNGG